MSLGLDQPSITSASLPETPPAHKSAGLAFLISLLAPGSGQIYCGKVARGGTTLAFFVLSVALTGVGFGLPDATGEELLGIAMLAVVILYVFSFLDAYYVAREINAGIDSLVDSSNPRVATTLNLLTNGFGYWYLGERNKGWVAFIVLGVIIRGASRALGNSPWSLLLLVIPSAMAVDAYRIAKRQLVEARTSLPHPSIRPAEPETRLPSAIPIALACLLPLGLVGVIVIGLAVPKFDPVDQSHAVVDVQSNPRRYENLTYGVTLLAPNTWDLDQSDKQHLITAKRGAGCQVTLIGQAAAPFRSLGADVNALATDLPSRNKNFRKVGEHSAMLGSLAGEEIQFIATFGQNDVIQRYLLARKGLALYVLVTTIGSSRPAECEPDAGWIRENIRVQR